MKDLDRLKKKIYKKITKVIRLLSDTDNSASRELELSAKLHSYRSVIKIIDKMQK